MGECNLILKLHHIMDSYNLSKKKKEKIFNYINMSSEGGLELRGLNEWNEAAMMKHIWNHLV